jgi:hypothetical protein
MNAMVHSFISLQIFEGMSKFRVPPEYPRIESEMKSEFEFEKWRRENFLSTLLTPFDNHDVQKHA